MEVIGSLGDFSDDIILMLNRLMTVFCRKNQGFYCFLPMNNKKSDHVRHIGEFVIASGSGRFSKVIGKRVYEVLLTERLCEVNAAVQENHIFYGKEYVSVYFKTKKGMDSALYIEMKTKPADIFTFEVLMDCFRVLVTNYELHREKEFTERELIYMLGEAAELRSAETGEHLRRVAEYSRILARAYGLPKREVELIYSASPMHDIGKLGVADIILNKPGKLLKEEYEKMKEHCQIGYDMLSRLDQPITKMGARIALEHHEKYNGMGYPYGLKGEDISLGARIVAVADVFDALGTERVYKKAWKQDEILKFFISEKEKHFDPRLVDLFLKNLDEIIAIM